MYLSAFQLESSTQSLSGVRLVIQGIIGPVKKEDSTAVKYMRPPTIVRRPEKLDKKKLALDTGSQDRCSDRCYAALRSKAALPIAFRPSVRRSIQHIRALNPRTKAVRKSNPMNLFLLAYVSSIAILLPRSHWGTSTKSPNLVKLRHKI